MFMDETVHDGPGLVTRDAHQAASCFVMFALPKPLLKPERYQQCIFLMAAGFSMHAKHQ